MRKNKVLAVGVCATMLAAAMVGGTLAYLTDTDAQTNTFTVGDVAIDLWENFGDNDEEGIEDLIPGVDVNKDVYVTNTGSNDAYVRVHVAIPAILDSGREDQPQFAAYNNMLHWNFSDESVSDGKWNWNADAAGSNYPGNGGAWNYYEATIDGVDYNVYVATYETVVAPGETTIDAISNVYLDTKMTNDMVSSVKEEIGDDWKVRVFAEAVQTEGFRDAQGDVDAYTALNEAFGVPGTYTIADWDTSTGTKFANEVTNDTAVKVGSINAGATSEGGVVSDLRIVDGTDSDVNLRALHVASLVNDLAIVDSYLDGTYALEIDIASSGYKLTAQNTTFRGWTTYGAIASAEFTDCSFGWNSEGAYAHLRPRATTTLNGCSFEENFTIGTDKGKKITVYLNDCTCEGQAITAANFAQFDCGGEYGLATNDCIVYVDGELVVW